MKLATLFFAAVAIAAAAAGRPFVHPGIIETRSDLDFVKAKVAAGEEPWKHAWDNLLRQPYSSLEFHPHPVAHIARGSFGRSSVGDRDLSAGADAAYSQALQWYVTGDRAHARKAIEVLNAWSRVLWDFEGNDAKLLAGWTGGTLCDAAEILRATDSGWQPSDILQFRRMLMTVYYPLLRDYFPEANGNWDAAIIHSLLAIGIFCDDHPIFDNAVEHYLRGRGNGGITKYIYPDGQCQESTRDQGHVQLGLDYFARAARIAGNQGVDLWGAADNRLALGFEYTAKYMLGDEVPSIGTISPVGRGRFRDIYEPAYQYYHFARGFSMPYTERAIAQTRGDGWQALVMYRGAPPSKDALPLSTSTRARNAGALAGATAKPPDGALVVAPGDSIQKALDRQAAAGSGWVVLAKGLHTLPSTLHIPSGITLAGQGKETIVYLDPKAPAANAAVAIANATSDLHDVTLRDFVVEGSTLSRPPLDPNQDRRIRSYQHAPSREGIVFAGDHPGQIRNLHFEHLSVRNCTHNGVAITGASHVTVVASDFSSSGSSVVPGPGLEHNLRLSYTTEVEVRDSRFDDSLWGSGIDLSFSRDVAIADNEFARNAGPGLRITDSENVRVGGNLSEGNDSAGIDIARLFDTSRAVVLRDNLVRNNGARGIAIPPGQNPVLHGNTLTNNGAVQFARKLLF